jgi:hypothetical protein
MRVPTSVVLAASLSLAAATPGLALTVTQPPLGSDSPASRYHDDDGAHIDNLVGQVHQSVENSLRAQGGGAFTGGASRTPYGYSSQASQFGPVTGTTETYRDDLDQSAPPAAYAPPLLVIPAHRP